MSERYDRVKNDVKNMTDCICPKCRGIHRVKIFWTGNGIPRIYCHNCRFHSIALDDLYEEAQKVDIYHSPNAGFVV